MPELYDRVRQSNSKYVPQFVGSNFDTLKSVGDTLQNRYNLNEQAMTDALAASINEQYAPGDEQIGLNIYKDLGDIREKIAGSDESFENSSALVKQAVRDKILTNRNRIEGLRNAAEYKKYQDQLTALGAEAVDFTPKFTGTVNEDGTFNRFKGDVQKRLDYNKPKELLFDDFESDIRNLGFTIDPATGTLRGGSVKENEQKIKDYWDKAHNRYKENSKGEYEQERRVLMKQGLTKEQAEQKIKDSILEVGLEKKVKQTHLTSENLSHDTLSRLFGDQTNKKPSYETSEVKEYKPAILDRGKLGVNVPVNKTINKTDHYIIGGERFPVTPENTKMYEEQAKIGNAKLVEEYTMGDGETLARTPQLDDLYNTVTTADKQAVVKGYEDNYKALQGEEKENFEAIVRNSPEFKKALKSEAGNSSKGSNFFKSEAAFKIVNNYMDQLEQKQISEITPIITEGYDDILDEQGRTLRDKETDNVRANFGSRVFYNPQTGNKISGSSPNVVKEFNDEFDTDYKDITELKKGVEIRGEFSPKNLFKHISKNDALVAPLAGTVNGKDVAVTRRASDLEDGKYDTYKLINKAYVALNKLPGIPAKVNLEGTEFDIKQTDDGKFELKTGDRTFVLDSLEDLPTLFIAK